MQGCILLRRPALEPSLRSPRTTMKAGLPVALVLLVVMLHEGQMVLGQPGSWQVLVNNSGLSSMHTAVTHLNSVVFLERTSQGATSLLLPDGKCRIDPTDKFLTKDCYAHSSVMSLSNNGIRPLMIVTDTLCSAGQFMADGTLQQIGGNNNGFRVVSSIRYQKEETGYPSLGSFFWRQDVDSGHWYVFPPHMLQSGGQNRHLVARKKNTPRTFTPCPANGTCDWVETTTRTQVDRWYSTAQILPDKRIIVVGGRSAHSYEFIPSTGTKAIFLKLLNDSISAKSQPDNLYPFVHLLPDGTLYIFANTKSIKLNYVTNEVVTTYPELPGAARNYPSAGSSVMLPLSFVDQFKSAEVLVCGGAAKAAFTVARGHRIFLPCQQTCGRMKVTDTKPSWTMETMPMKRCMGDMLLLPDQNVLIINGAAAGSQTEGRAKTPVLTPVLYQTNIPEPRFLTMAASTIPRMYHSTANLLPDGRVMAAGSNDNVVHTYSNVSFPTELALDAFSPPYLAASQNPKRPTITFVPPSAQLGSTFLLRFSVPDPGTVTADVNVVVNSSPFSTHSYSQGLRMLKLRTAGQKAGVGGLFEVTVAAPPNANVAPQAYYMCWVMNQNIPSKAEWLQLT